MPSPSFSAANTVLPGSFVSESRSRFPGQGRCSAREHEGDAVCRNCCGRTSNSERYVELSISSGVSTLCRALTRPSSLGSEGFHLGKRRALTPLCWVQTRHGHLLHAPYKVVYDPVIRSQLASTQLTCGPCVVQMWSRNTPELKGAKCSSGSEVGSSDASVLGAGRGSGEESWLQGAPPHCGTG